MKSKNCHLCRKPFRLEDEKIDLGVGKFKTIPKDIIVRDHCHITSEFRGAAHHICNLKATVIPLYSERLALHRTLNRRNQW